MSSSVGDALDEEIAKTTEELRRMGVSVPTETETICSQFHELSNVTKHYHIPTISPTGAPPDNHHPKHHLTIINKSILIKHATDELGLKFYDPDIKPEDQLDTVDTYLFSIEQNEMGFQSTYERVIDHPTNIQDLHILAQYTIFMIKLIAIIGTNTSSETVTSLNHNSEHYFKDFVHACDTCSKASQLVD